MILFVDVFSSCWVSFPSECFSNFEFNPLGYSVFSVFIHLASVCIRSAFTTCWIGVTLKFVSKLSLCNFTCW